MAQNAYSSPHSSVRTASTQEYDAIARITSALRSAETAPSRAAAIHRNRELWATLATDVATDGNGLPTELRAGIFYLAEFTRQHSSKVLNDEASPDILVEINTSIMRGLRQQGLGK
nr:flagellar biosynthesis regulator FlaF [Palleronia pontilimi]